MNTFKIFALTLCVNLVLVPNLAYSQTFNANGELQNGCEILTTSSGVLKNNAALTKLDTNPSVGGTRPYLQVRVIGSATIDLSSARWEKDGGVITPTSVNYMLMNTSSGGSQYVLPFVLPYSSPWDFYLEASAASNTLFKTSGTYKVYATFTCV